MYLMKGDKEMAVINVVGDYSISIDKMAAHTRDFSHELAAHS